MSAPYQNSPLLSIITDCLRLIVSYIDPASMVSMALTSKFFTFEDETPDDELPASPKPLLPLFMAPFKGIKLLVECVKHNYPNLFDEWAGLIHIKRYENHSIGKMMEHAGTITPISNARGWVAKIQAFIYSRPILAEQTPFWTEYTKGIIKSNDPEHYVAAFPTTDNQHSHFDLAAKVGAIKIASCIQTTYPDENFFSFNKGLVGKSSPEFLGWYLDTLHSLSPAANIDAGDFLGRILSNCISEENAKIVLSHPYFAGVNDEDIGHLRNVELDVVFVILSFRPNLLWGQWELWRIFCGGNDSSGNEEIDPRAIPYIQTFTVPQFLTVSRGMLYTFSAFKRLFAATKIDTSWSAHNQELIKFAQSRYDFEDAVRMFLPEDPEKRDEYYKYISTNHISFLYSLLGTDVLPDEVVLKMVREHKMRTRTRD